MVQIEISSRLSTKNPCFHRPTRARPCIDLFSLLHAQCRARWNSGRQRLYSPAAEGFANGHMISPTSRYWHRFGAKPARAQQHVQGSVRPSGMSFTELQTILGVDQKASMQVLLHECPELAELPPSRLMLRLTELKEMYPDLNPTDLILLDPNIVTREKPTLLPAINLGMARKLLERLAIVSQEFKVLDGGVQFSEIVPYMDDGLFVLYKSWLRGQFESDPRREANWLELIRIPCLALDDARCVERELEEILNARHIQGGISERTLDRLATEELLQAIHASPRPVEWEVGQRSHYVSFLLKMLKLDWSDADVELLCN